MDGGVPPGGSVFTVKSNASTRIILDLGVLAFDYPTSGCQSLQTGVLGTLQAVESSRHVVSSYLHLKHLSGTVYSRKGPY